MSSQEYIDRLKEMVETSTDPNDLRAAGRKLHEELMMTRKAMVEVALPIEVLRMTLFSRGTYAKWFTQALRDSVADASNEIRFIITGRRYT